MSLLSAQVSAADNAHADPNTDYGEETRRPYPPSRKKARVSAVFAKLQFGKVESRLYPSVGVRPVLELARPEVLRSSRTDIDDARHDASLRESRLR